MTGPQSVVLHGFAHGGEAVGRLPDGRVVFVAHAIPGETVTVEITEDHPRWCRGRLVEVVEASPDRVAPPCPYFGVDRCGGCKLQHIDASLQKKLLRQVVVDQLERLGRIPDPPVAETIGAGEYGYRNRARFGVTAEGALGYRRHQSNELLPIGRCLLLDEPTQRVRDTAGDQFTDVAEVEVRSGTTGAAIVLDPAGSATAQVLDPLAEEIAGLRFAVSPTSFFQSNRAGAGILVELVRAAAAVGPGDTALDLYAGVGLFAKSLMAQGATVTAVEGSASSVADARRNLGASAEVIAGSVSKAIARLVREARVFDVVVLDPPRQGAGKDVIAAVAKSARRSIVVVACDPAALGRDAGILARAGWQLAAATPVDQFAQTGHIEVVAHFVRPAPT